MSALPLAVSFCLPMAQKEKTVQLGVRIKASVKDRVERFCIRHPYQPSMAAVIERALTELLDREEPKLPKPHKAK